MSARTLSYQGTVVPDHPQWEQPRARLVGLAEQFPAGLRIVHTGGREGTVALDQPEHVPGLFSGKPSAVCLMGEWLDVPMVFAHWDNEYEIRWGVWVPVAAIRRGTASAANRPGNKARIGGRR